MVQIQQGEGSYPPGATWADPDTEEVAMYMKKLKECPTYYLEMVEKAYAHVSATLGIEKVSELLRGRIQQIYTQFSNTKR